MYFVECPMRLWRARKRHDAIDASLEVRDDDVRVTLLLNKRRLWRAEFETEDAAKAAAEAKLKDLQRAGWNVHW